MATENGARNRRRCSRSSWCSPSLATSAGGERHPGCETETARVRVSVSPHSGWSWELKGFPTRAPNRPKKLEENLRRTDLKERTDFYSYLHSHRPQNVHFDCNYPASFEDDGNRRTMHKKKSLISKFPLSIQRCGHRRRSNAVHPSRKHSAIDSSDSSERRSNMIKELQQRKKL